MKNTIAQVLIVGGAAVGTLYAAGAAAIDWNITGFARQEMAIGISNEENPNNLATNGYNDRIMPQLTSAAFNAANAGLPVTQVNTAAPPTHTAGTNTNSAVFCRFSHLNAIAAGSPGLTGVAVGRPGAFRGVLCPNGGGSFFVPGFVPGAGAGFSAQGDELDDDYNFNLFASRLEVDVQAKINDSFAAYAKFRAFYDGTAAFTDADMGAVFSNDNFWGGRRALPTTLASNTRYEIDVPAFYLDYNNGPLWIRVGNQTIAWGEAYFFRVMDVANGLDLRRHLTLGPGAEEYQDQRIGAPGVRLSYTFQNAWELDAYVQMWTPTVFPGQDSPYSVVGHAVNIMETDELDDARGAVNYGFRLSMPLTDQFTAMFAYTGRRDPVGTFRFAEAPNFNGQLDNRFCLGNGNTNDTTRFLAGAFGLPNSTPSTAFGAPALVPGSKTLDHCGSNVAPDPYAPGSIEGWRGTMAARLDPMKTLINLVSEWPGNAWQTRTIFNFGEEIDPASYFRTVEGFQSSFGGFRAWVTREFKREHIFVWGGNYIINSDDPDSIWDQLIIRGEVSWTPNKDFTNNLSFDFKEDDDIVSALILEKYHRFTDAFPATYMVAQWMHRTTSDLFGTHLSGMEGSDITDIIDPVTGTLDPTIATTPGALAPKGSSNADYVVFAFQQPFPNLIWRFDFAVLVDVEGGYLVQPGVRFRPSAKWQWDLYANLLQSGGDKYDDIIEYIDYADEVFLRVSYFF
jgi:hypothetical protein